MLTDGTLFIGDTGEVFKGFNVQDGVAVELLRMHCVELAVLSGKASNALEFRCKQLGIHHAIFGCKNKTRGVEALMKAYSLSSEQVIFCGEDVIDLPAMYAVGFSVVPANAHRLVKQAAGVVIESRGGEGVLRELADVILELQCGSLDIAYAPLLISFGNDTAQQAEQ